MTVIRKGNIDKKTEKKILTSAITSTQFLQETKQFLTPQIFQIPYARRIFKWIYTYFQKYEEAPNRTILDLFNAEKKGLTNEDQELISDFLEDISHEYVENGGESSFNCKFAVDSAREWAKKRNLQLKISEVNGLVSLDRLDEAEGSLLGYQKVAASTSSWQNPFDDDVIHNHFERKETNELFRFPGAVGELIGGFERNRLYVVAAPLKLGKSWMMQEAAILAMTKKLKVVIFNMEMGHQAINSRIYKRISATADEECDTEYVVVDCKNSQNGSCKLAQRIGNVPLYAHEDHIPEYGEHDQNYKVCTACRGTKGGLFSPTTWFEPIHREELEQSLIEKKSKAMTKMFGKNLMVRTYPKFSASVSDMASDLDMLETAHDFRVDVIIVDYPQLLRAGNTRNDVRHQISDVWQELGSIASKRDCCIIGAAQINRAGSKKKMSDSSDIGESYAIGQHCDLMINLAQTEVQKRRGIISVGVGAKRDGESSPGKVVHMLGDLKTGQVCLDSFWA